MSNEKKLALILGIEFRDTQLLKTALIHRSYLNEHPNEPESNERLEFLGDAVLEFVVSDYLFRSFQNFQEGTLTATRSKIVNTQNLANFARKHAIGSYLYLSRGEEESGGRDNTALLANTVEAIIGSLYLDQGITKVQNFIEENLLVNTEQIIREGLKDPKSSLQEYVQAKGYSAPVYKTIGARGPDHSKTFTVVVSVSQEVLGKGIGKSKSEAQKNAAEEALKAVEEGASLKS